MLSLNVGSNIGEVAGWLNTVQRKQLPFATAVALQNTAFDVRRKAVGDTFPSAFTSRNRTFAKGVLIVEPSRTKGAARRRVDKRKLHAAVYARDHVTDYLETHARGGHKIPFDGKHLAIPVRELRDRRGARGIPKSYRPKAVLAKKKSFINTTRKTGQLMILQRKTKKQYPLRAFYILEPRAKITKSLRFYEDAAKVVQRRLAPNFRQSFDKAMRTAKR